MKTIILQRYGPFTLNGFKRGLENALLELGGPLKASAKLGGYSKRGWAIVDIDGEDSEILEELISRKFFRAQTDLGGIDPQGVYEGIIHGEVKGKLEVDIGIETPKQVNATLSPSVIRAQLADGKTLDVNQIIRDYCLIPGGRASIRVTRVEPDFLEAWFADTQIDWLSSWIAAGLDRIQIPDCFQYEAEAAIQKSGIERDIVSVDPLTLTAHSVTCKLGTDAVGLIPKLGKALRKHELHPFIPRSVLARCRPW